jgi:hypothetical protein
MGRTRSSMLLMGTWILLAVSNCGSPESNSTCDELYGGVAGYQLCAQTDSSCSFYRNNRPEPEITCAAICVSRGALCLSAFEEGDPNVCDVGPMLCEDPLACEDIAPCQVPAADSVCVCGNPSPSNP